MRSRTRIAFLLLVFVSAVAQPLARGKASDQCANPNALGVSRTVEIDTTGGPGFGFEHYKAYDFLVLKEVVLTFDDGPQVNTTHAILAALANECTKATFFSIGKMAAGMPEILREVAEAGHTIGTHTWSHADLSKLKTEAEWKGEIEKAVSVVHRAVGGPISPFFRYPYLKDSKETLAHLANRNMAIFSTDIDSFDFKFHADHLVKSLMAKLDKKGKGIILMHDIQPGTAKAVPQLLAELKAKGYKIVHMKPKFELKSLPEYDTMIEKDVKGLAAGTDRPLRSIVRTIEGSPASSTTAPAPPN
jgi:peptidoglycan/xylan/chitin deacetylase (PgdA/CDA1 family)